jgi:hypothetical protein
LRTDRPKAYQIPLSLFWAVLLTSFTGFLGSAPLKVLRSFLNPIIFPVVTSLPVALLFYFGFHYLALILTAQAVLVALYSEFEEQGFNLVQSAGAALSITISMCAAGSYIWLSYFGRTFVDKISADMQAFITKAIELQPELGQILTFKSIVEVTPALLVIFLILSMAAAVILEKPFLRRVGLKPKRKERLTDFTLPDFLIWPLIAALLFANLETNWLPSLILGKNILYITLCAYFLQGLAVMFRMFEVYKFTVLSRVFFVFLFAIQFQVVLAVTGVADYWINFRKMFSRRVAQANKQT